MLAGFAAIDPLAKSYYAAGQWVGDDPVACERAGGSVRIRYGYLDQYGRGQPPVTFTCIMPAKAPAQSAPSAPVNVTTNVQTQASPQISPVFVQQDEPRNSPVTAGTSQVAPATQSASGGPSKEYLDLLAQRDEQERAERAAREERIFELLANERAAPASAEGGSVYVPPPPVTYSDGGAGAEAEPSIQRAPAQSNMLLIGAAVIGGLLLMRGKRKGK